MKLVSNDGLAAEEECEHVELFPDLDRKANIAADAFQARAYSPSLAEALTTADKIPRQPAAVRVLNAALQVLPNAVHDAELANPAEFHSLFQLMLGFGLAPDRVAQHLEVGSHTVSRYANGASAPATIHARRGALVETLRLVREDVHSGELACLAHFRK